MGAAAAAEGVEVETGHVSRTSCRDGITLKSFTEAKLIFFGDVKLVHEVCL